MFYPSAERIWLCMRLNNARKYCVITLKIMVMLQNECEICVKILEEEKHVSFVFLLHCEKVKDIFILIDKPKREKPVRTSLNIAAMAESVREAPSTSIRRRSQQLNISEILLRRILHKDLGMTPYKVHLVKELKPTNHPMQFRSAK